jgi:hypothetical protein
MPNESIFQLSVLVYAVVAMVLMLMPVLFVEDNSGKNITQAELQFDAKHKNIFDNMREVWNDKNFRVLSNC